MGNGLMQNMTAILGGAGLGAALMYLFDPDMGSNRRQEVAATAGDAVTSTGDAVGATVQGASSTARNIAHRINAYAHELAGTIGERATDFASGASKRVHGAADSAANSARSYASDVSHQAGDVRDHFNKHFQSMWSKTRHAAQMEESNPYTTAAEITAGSIGVLALGAGLMYFMDPQRGRARRAWVSDKAFSISRRTGRQARQYGRHLGNRMKGVVAEAGRSMPGHSSMEEESMPSAR